MTDKEMMKLCAEAMGAKLDAGDEYYWLNGHTFEPLLYDAQAMALVKRFRLDIYGRPGTWDALYDIGTAHARATSADLNRAIVECVAMMQSAKVPA